MKITRDKINPEPLLKVQNLSLGFHDRVLVRNLNFEIFAGDFLCIVSSNGVGKTTLVSTILGLLRPKSGKIIFGSGLKTTEIGYLPQETKIDPNFPATVFEVVLTGALNQMRLKPFYTAKEKTLAEEKLKLLKIMDLKHQSFAELSGGQKQKVLLARALAATSKLLILDEPSNNLDLNSKKDFYSLLLKLNREKNLTIIMITHDLDHDNLIGDKILALKNQLFFGETKDFVKMVHHEKDFETQNRVGNAKKENR